MKDLFNPGYFNSEDLIKMGFGKVGNNVQIAKNSTIVGIKNIFLGDDIRIDGYTTIIAANKGKLYIGNNVHIGGYALLSCGDDIVMSDFSGISHGVRIYTSNDDFSGESLTNPTIPKKFTNVKKGKVTLGKHVIVGSGSVILPGVNIGDGSCVGALSLVTNSLEEWGIYFGSPLKRIKKRSQELLKLEKLYLKEKNTA